MTARTDTNKLKPGRDPIDRVLADVQAFGSVPFATADHRGLAWIVFFETKKGRRLATIVGFEDRYRRDMEYATAQAFGGNFDRMAQVRGPEIGVRQYVEAQGYTIDSATVRG